MLDVKSKGNGTRDGHRGSEDEEEEEEEEAREATSQCERKNKTVLRLDSNSTIRS